MIPNSTHDWSPGPGNSTPNLTNKYKNDWQLPENPWLKNIQPPQEQAQGAAQAPVLDNPDAPMRQPDYQMPDQSQLLHPMVEPKAQPSGGLFAQFMNRMVNPSGAPVDHTMPVKSSGGGFMGAFLPTATGSILDMMKGAAQAPTGIAAFMDPNRYRNNGGPLLMRDDGQPVPPPPSDADYYAQLGISPESQKRWEDMINSGQVQF